MQALLNIGTRLGVQSFTGFVTLIHAFEADLSPRLRLAGIKRDSDLGLILLEAHTCEAITGWYKLR